MTATVGVSFSAGSVAKRILLFTLNVLVLLLGLACSILCLYQVKLMPETYDVIIAALMEANLTVPPPLPTAEFKRSTSSTPQLPGGVSNGRPRVSRYVENNFESFDQLISAVTSTPPAGVQSVVTSSTKPKFELQQQTTNIMDGIFSQLASQGSLQLGSTVKTTTTSQQITAATSITPGISSSTTQVSLNTAVLSEAQKQRIADLFRNEFGVVASKQTLERIYESVLQEIQTSDPSGNLQSPAAWKFNISGFPVDVLTTKQPTTVNSLPLVNLQGDSATLSSRLSTPSTFQTTSSPTQASEEFVKSTLTTLPALSVSQSSTTSKPFTSSSSSTAMLTSQDSTSKLFSTPTPVALSTTIKSSSLTSTSSSATSKTTSLPLMSTSTVSSAAVEFPSTTLTPVSITSEAVPTTNTFREGDLTKVNILSTSSTSASTTGSLETLSTTENGLTLDMETTTSFPPSTEKFQTLFISDVPSNSGVTQSVSGPTTIEIISTSEEASSSVSTVFTSEPDAVSSTATFASSVSTLPAASSAATKPIPSFIDLQDVLNQMFTADSIAPGKELNEFPTSPLSPLDSFADATTTVSSSTTTKSPSGFIDLSNVLNEFNAELKSIPTSILEEVSDRPTLPFSQPESSISSSTTSSHGFMDLSDVLSEILKEVDPLPEKETSKIPITSMAPELESSTVPQSSHASSSLLTSETLESGSIDLSAAVKDILNGAIAVGPSTQEAATTTSSRPVTISSTTKSAPGFVDLSEVLSQVPVNNNPSIKLSSALPSTSAPTIRTTTRGTTTTKSTPGFIDLSAVGNKLTKDLFFLADTTIGSTSSVIPTTKTTPHPQPTSQTTKATTAHATLKPVVTTTTAKLLIATIKPIVLTTSLKPKSSANDLSSVLNLSGFRRRRQVTKRAPSTTTISPAVINMLNSENLPSYLEDIFFLVQTSLYVCTAAGLLVFFASLVGICGGIFRVNGCLKFSVAAVVVVIMAELATIAFIFVAHDKASNRNKYKDFDQTLKLLCDVANFCINQMMLVMIGSFLCLSVVLQIGSITLSCNLMDNRNSNDPEKKWRKMMRSGRSDFQFMGTSGGGGAMYSNPMPMSCYGGVPYPSPMMMAPMQNMSYMNYPQPVMSGPGQRPIINIIS